MIALFFREQSYRGCKSKQLRSNQLLAPFEEWETITEISGAAQRWLTAKTGRKTEIDVPVDLQSLIPLVASVKSSVH